MIAGFATAVSSARDLLSTMFLAEELVFMHDQGKGFVNDVPKLIPQNPDRQFAVVGPGESLFGQFVLKGGFVDIIYGRFQDFFDENNGLFKGDDFFVANAAETNRVISLRVCASFHARVYEFVSKDCTVFGFVRMHDVFERGCAAGSHRSMEGIERIMLRGGFLRTEGQSQTRCIGSQQS